MLAKVPEDLVRVGRWMSSQEYALLVSTGRVQESTSGTTHVAFPADGKAFQAQALQGSFYVEFDIPASSVKATQQEWAKILGPNTLEGRQARRAGTPIPQMPTALNIQHLATK